MKKPRTITIHINLPLKTILETAQEPNVEELEYSDDEMFMCEACYGFGYTGTNENPEDCEACDGHGIQFEALEEEEWTDDDEADPDWLPDIDDMSDTDLSLDDLTDLESDEDSDCGNACNDKICFCGKV